MFRRCYSHRSISRKEYLEDYKISFESYDDTDSFNKQMRTIITDLNKEIYPKPATFSKQVIHKIVERRAKKRIRINKVSSKERDLFKTILGVAKLKQLETA